MTDAFRTRSPRWLTKKDRHEEAVAALSHVRAAPVDSDEVVHEIGEIRASCEEEKRASAGMTWKECLKPGARYVETFARAIWSTDAG